MRKLRKILLGIAIGIFTTGLLSTLSTVKADSAGPMYLGIIPLRSSGYGYEQSALKVWKIAKYDSLSGTTADTSNLIYCIKAGAGFGSENYTTTIKSYNQRFNLKDINSITTPYVNVLPTGTNYNKLLWIIDNLYTGIGSNNTTARNAFLQNIIPNEKYELLNDDDIDVVQQLAIWYFTNPSGMYHYDDIELYINSTKNVDADYKTFEDLDTTNGWDRQDAAKALYNYFITKADGTYKGSTATTSPIQLLKTNAQMQTIGSNYVAGPYQIKDNNLGVNYTISATYNDHGTNNAITPQLGVKDSTGNIVATSKTLKELEGTDFYLMMPTSSNIKGIDMTVNTSYSGRAAEYWSIENAPSTEQPVVLVKDKTYNFSDTASLVVTEDNPFDLSLRKFITEINGTPIAESREPKVDVTALAAGTATTATYNHSKTPLKVAIGDVVTYTIRVYNEGKVDGYAEEITDFLPDQLEFIADDQTNKQYEWELSSDLKTVKTKYLSKENDTSTRPNKIVAFNGSTLQYKDVKIKCRVKNTTPMVSKITNISEITGFKAVDSSGNEIANKQDRDSQPGNVVLPSSTDLPNYKDQEIARGEEYIPGQQDDDDFEKVMLKEFDLALRKFVTNVNGTEITNRIPQVDTTALAAGTSTTATYNHPKTVVNVNIGDTVTYTIRVYNEGEVDGYANEITDHLPDQLQFLPDNDINKQYGWTVDNTNPKAIKTDYLSKTKDTTGSNKIAPFDGKTLSYKDVKVVCKVIQTTPMVKRITNIAEITAFTDGNGNNVTDRDSQPNNVNIPQDLPGYKDDELNKAYVPGQQDDDDFEKLGVGEFDLALRKFITGVNTTSITNRIPQVDTTALAAGTSTTATYNHTKDPVLVSSGCIVTYTIRIYNEGDINGYAKQIKDDVPKGLEYLPDNDINKQYGWTMLDKDNNSTTNIADATTVATNYLSKEHGETQMKNDPTIKANPMLIKAFDGKTLDYKDVKIAFKVTEPTTSDRIIINKAQIAQNTNESGNDIKDRDSTPDQWNEGEDDQDIEKVKVQYFDLALRKWTTQVILTDAGKTTVTETGHKAEDDPEGIVKVDLKSSKLNKVTLKFRYKIRVINQGQIPGYAKQIEDYIPDGLKFVPEDNPTWQQIGDKTIATDQTKDTLLQPGDITEVEVVLTWINGNDNLGLKDNWAEIGKDYNEFNSPDIDSTPNNQKIGEDDMDDAPVLISVQTGQVRMYVLITGIVLIVLGSGIVLIKKFVK